MQNNWNRSAMEWRDAAPCAQTHLAMLLCAKGAMPSGEAVPKQASNTSSSAMRALSPSNDASLLLPSRPV